MLKYLHDLQLCRYFEFRSLHLNLSTCSSTTQIHTILKKVTIILSLAILASCSAKLVKPAQTDADRGSSKFPGLTVEQLHKGNELYNSKCTTCHPAKNPTSWTEEQWRNIVPNMASASKEHGKGEITAAEQDLILKYVITMGPAKKG